MTITSRRLGQERKPGRRFKKKTRTDRLRRPEPEQENFQVEDKKKTREKTQEEYQGQRQKGDKDRVKKNARTGEEEV